MYAKPQGNRVVAPVNFAGFAPNIPVPKEASANPKAPLERKTIKIDNQPYAFKNKIGQGGFGAVYNGVRLSDRKPVAIKVVSLAKIDGRSAARCAESILTEIKMIRRLKAESFRQLIEMYDFDFHKHTGLAFITMEPGLYNLETGLMKKGRLDGKHRKLLWKQLVDIAVGLHTRNIVHRDIKPQNLLVFPNHQIKLIDLGIAKRANTNVTRSNGTNRYSAPEIVSPAEFPYTKVTSTADSWSWGAILYRVVYLEPPNYSEPCSYPPKGKNRTSDPVLADLLKRTLVRDPRYRLRPPQLAEHKYIM